MLVRRFVAGAVLVAGAAALIPADTHGQEVDRPTYTCIVTTTTTTQTTYKNDGSYTSVTLVVTTKVCTPN